MGRGVGRGLPAPRTRPEVENVTLVNSKLGKFLASEAETTTLYFMHQRIT